MIIKFYFIFFIIKFNQFFIKHFFILIKELLNFRYLYNFFFWIKNSTIFFISDKELN